MTFTEHNGTYLIRFMPGEELLETLFAFCQEHGITGGSISGIGGTTNVTLQYFNSLTKEYQEKKFSGELFEVTNLTGNISVEKLHVHITIADKEFHAWAGHCGAVVADPTLEIMITPFSETHRKLDEYSGLNLLDLN